jgi:diguanylate cyclase (GGDEF)-like protein
LVRASAPLLPLGVLAFVVVNRERASGVALAIWAVATLVVNRAGFHAMNSQLRAGEPWVRIDDRRVHALLAAGAMCWGVTPYFTGEPHGAADPAIALMFPVIAAALITIVSAPRPQRFAMAQLLVLGPAILWLPTNGARLWSELVVLLLGYAMILAIVQRHLHDLVRRGIDLDLRNTSLEAVLSEEHQSAERATDALADAHRRLSHQETHDPLTGLLNRHGLFAALDDLLYDIDQRGGQVSVLLCDLDRFKVINDSLGHTAGDQLLAMIAARLSAACVTPMLLGRLGGDEFVVAARWNATDDPRERTAALAKHLRAVTCEPMMLDATEIVVTCSIGTVQWPEHGGTGRDLLRHADAAMHRAKEAGRDRTEPFDDQLRASLARKMGDEQNVRQALERGEIVPWYQPIVDADTGRIVGAELLARWIAPDRPAMGAGSFISLVQESGLMDRLSEVVIERGLSDLDAWARRGLPTGFRLGVNLPPRYVSRSGRVRILGTLFDSARCDLLTAEVTETSVVDDLTIAARRLADLRERGMTVVLDDFGTGSASLTLLQRVPLDGVKIDRSFVTNIVDEQRDQALVGAFVGLADALGIVVTAEGVESEEQADVLRRLGCRKLQGYLYGHAISADELSHALRTTSANPLPRGRETPSR